MTDLDARLIAAIHRNALGDEARRVVASAAPPDDVWRATAALDSCRRIAAEMAAESERLQHLLTQAGVEVRPVPVPELAQRHEVMFHTTREEARRALVALDTAGFRPFPEWTGGAERSFWSTSNEIRLTRSTSWTTVVTLRWGPPPGSSRLARTFRPRPADWDAVRLPEALWWAYHVVRPVRLLLERTGLRRRDLGALEPFLSTPASVVGPLLELAAVTSTDVVADVGCGDGRLVVAAASTTGCRAVGIEYSPALVAAARRAVADAGLGDRVRIVEGDGRGLDLDDVTVVLLFLPMLVAVDLVPGLLARLPNGARLVLHEQSRLDERLPPPTSSTPIVTADAVTVGHLWRVGSCDLGDAPHVSSL